MLISIEGVKVLKVYWKFDALEMHGHLISEDPGTKYESFTLELRIPKPQPLNPVGRRGRSSFWAVNLMTIVQMMVVLVQDLAYYKSDYCYHSYSTQVS